MDKFTIHRGLDGGDGQGGLIGFYRGVQGVGLVFPIAARPIAVDGGASPFGKDAPLFALPPPSPDWHPPPRHSQVCRIQQASVAGNPEQKRQIIQKLTDAMVSIEGENMRGVTWVKISEVTSGEWGIGGKPLPSTQVAVRSLDLGHTNRDLWDKPEARSKRRWLAIVSPIAPLVGRRRSREGGSIRRLGHRPNLSWITWPRHASIRSLKNARTASSLAFRA